MTNNTREPDDIVEAEIVPDDVVEVDTVTPPPGVAPTDEDPGAALMRIVDNAVTTGMSIEVIERLLVVHERYEAGEARKKYAAAVAALRADLPAVVKTETVDYRTNKGPVHYRHENLARIIEDLSPAMAKHGLSFRWNTDTTIPSSIQVTCIVTHEAGHSEQTSLSGPPDDTGSKNVIQAIASTVSYLQRYTIKAMIGLAAGKDDDGQGGAPSQQAPLEQPRAAGQPATDPGPVPGDTLDVDELHQVRAMFPAAGSAKITTSQRGRLYNLAGKNGWANPAAVDGEVARVLSISTSEIPAVGDAYEAIVRWFQRHTPSAA